MNPFNNSRNPIASWILSEVSVPVGDIPQNDLFLIANKVRDKFKPFFPDLMSQGGAATALSEVLPFPILGRDVSPYTVAFDGFIQNPASFRCMALACLVTDPRFPQQGIDMARSVPEGQGRDLYLLIDVEGGWFGLERSFLLDPTDAIINTHYLVQPMSDVVLTGSLRLSPGALRQIVDTFVQRVGLEIEEKTPAFPDWKRWKNTPPPFVLGLYDQCLTPPKRGHSSLFLLKKEKGRFDINRNGQGTTLKRFTIKAEVPREFQFH